MSPPTLQELHAGLDALDGALDGNDIQGAAQIMSAYEARLRHYIEQSGREAPVDGLRNLLRMQNDLLASMHQRRDALGDDARSAQRAGQASRAYASVGVAL